MEQNGAVFLPVAGMRWGSDFDNELQIGCYWAATYQQSQHKGFHLYFNPDRLNPKAYQDPSMGFSVRLVLSIKKLFSHRLPDDWNEQRKFLGLRKKNYAG